MILDICYKSTKSRWIDNNYSQSSYIKECTKRTQAKLLNRILAEKAHSDKQKYFHVVSNAFNDSKKELLNADFLIP